MDFLQTAGGTDFKLGQRGVSDKTSFESKQRMTKVEPSTRHCQSHWGVGEMNARDD